jgi:uncharacterized protein (TIGR03067 family)
MCKRLPWLFLVLGIVGCPQTRDGAKPRDAGARPAEEVARLKGTWSGTVLFPNVPGGDVTVEFTSDTITITRNKPADTISYPYSLDSSKDPKWIDWIVNPRSDPPMPSAHGVYELTGDQLKICMSTGKRPSTIANDLGAVYTLTRK